jgi:hypothetical protein
MANRLSSGARVNQCGSASGCRARDAHGVFSSAARKPSHIIGTKRQADQIPGRDEFGFTPGVEPSETQRKNGAKRQVKQISARNANGVRDDDKGESYTAPVKANPGNLIKCKVGGGLMGHPLAHDNEAPYPLKLAAFFVQSFCPPDGITLDPFSGSGTTGHAALEHGRRYIGCDVRQSQADLTTRRLQTVTPGMFTGEVA